MSRKNYVRFASALAEVRELLGPRRPASVAHMALDSVESRIADILADDNPRFDRERFHAAAHGENRALRSSPPSGASRTVDTGELTVDTGVSEVAR